MRFNVQGNDICHKFNRYGGTGKGYSSLSSLTLNFYCHEITINKDFHSFVRQLRNLPRLKELNLVFDDYYNWDDPWSPYNHPYSSESEIYKILFPQLKYLSQLTRFKVTTYNTISNSCFKALADGIRHLRNLSSFCMDLKFGCDRLSSTTMQKFAFAISRLNKLSHLDLKFKGERSPDPKSNDSLWKSLARLENLVTLDLEVFKFLSLDSRSIKSFFESFKNLKSLSHLKLNFAECEEMSTEMIESLLHGFKYLGKLQIPHSLKGGRELERLKRISEERYFGLNLKELIVSFPRVPAFTEESAKGFAKFLLSMKRSLTYLSLDLTNLSRLTDKEMLEFFKHLSNLEVLKTLKLKFSDKPLTDYFIKNLSFRWSFLPNLSYLHLSFQRPSQITNQGLRALSNGLSMTKKLSHLDLYFGLLPKVSDSSFQAFLYGLENLANLSSLKLDLSEFSQVNNKTIHALSEALTSLHELKELDLDFSHCESLTNKALNYLVSGLRTLCRFKTFRLDLYNCQQVNEKGIEYLARGLEDLRNLSYVWLDIYKSKSISREYMRQISKKLKEKISFFSYSLEETDYDYLFYDARRKRKQ